jgi:hypothetical protein
MRSSAETAPPRRSSSWFEVWNRRAHYYLGLYLLLFVWLFCFTGLLLNHPEWRFADFWPTRKQSTIDRSIRRPPAGSDVQQARDILSQLGLQGEIEWTVERENLSRFEFRASRPGHIYEIKTDLDLGRATVQRIDVNAWGVMRILHTFSGVRAGDARNERDWTLTSIWVFAMDAVAAGLIVMVLGSYYMWWRLPRKRLWGLVALLSGWVTCVVFVMGFRLFP